MSFIRSWFVAHPGWAALFIFILFSAAVSYVWYGVRAKWYPGVETKHLPRWAQKTQAVVELIANVAQFVRILSGQASVPPGYRPPVLPTDGQRGAGPT